MHILNMEGLGTRLVEFSGNNSVNLTISPQAKNDNGTFTFTVMVIGGVKV